MLKLRGCSKLLWSSRTSSALKYSQVHVAQGQGDNFEVLIDRRKLRIPRTSEVLQIPSRDIAEIVALEWAGQKERDLSKIKKHTLYMTQLCYINQDLEGAKTVDELVDELLKYLTTDSVMFRTPYTTDESLDGSPGVKLKNMQDEQWGPIQEWFEGRFKCDLEVAHGFSLPKVPEQAKQSVGNYLKSYDRGALLALEQMCLAFKSIMISIMVIERKLDVEEALKLSRLENEYQKEIWGTVEYHHTVEEKDLLAKVSSQALFIRFLTEDIDSDPKLISDFVN